MLESFCQGSKILESKVWIVVGNRQRDLRVGVELAGAQSSTDAGIAAADDKQMHETSQGKGITLACRMPYGASLRGQCNCKSLQF
jgi:hypothetical protein